MRLAALFLAAALGLTAATHYVTITGLGGEPDYELRFSGVASDLDKTLQSLGPEAKIYTLKSATREQVRTTLARIAKEAAPQDALVVMLVGHGTYDGVEYKINLPGPDLTAAELASLLDRVPATRQLVVNMTSASGACMEVLKKPNRVVITATKTGTEKNATVFARYWAAALSDPAADTDKNETISALEAYRYAEAKTRNFYETQKRLATEHARVEEERQAAVFPVIRIGTAAAAARTPEKRALLAKKEDLEQQIDRLKYQKVAMDAGEYKKQLAALLLELAKTQEELDK